MAIAIIGGGISGLTTAWYLQQAGVAYDLFEASDRPGGTIRTQHHDGYLLETGPNSLQLSDDLRDLIQDLGLTEQLQDTAAVSANRYVLRNGHYRKLPGKPQQLLFSGFFSLKARYHILRELSRPAGPANPNETLAGFIRRRFGQELVDYALNPFISGIYAGDPEQLLLHKTFPQLAAMEQAHGSVLKGLAKSGGGQRRRIVSLQGGLQTLTDTLAQQLAHYHSGKAIVTIIRQSDGAYQLHTSAGALPTPYSAVVLALPAYAAAALLKPQFTPEAAALADVYYPPMAAVYSSYPRKAVTHPLDGFGALHPKKENRYAAGSVWTTSLFPERAPTGEVLFTTFVGGAQYEEQARQPEAAQKAAVHQELSQLYGIQGQPTGQFRYYWERAIPQFDARIVPAHAAAATLAEQCIYTTANWLAGVGVPDCIRHARRLAGELASH
ncbi:protoporphyrinogen oxidase [Hymenobacter aerilatus]|uniref:Coproporphyrinogen III oxidase n=1 Tax=Hymenobacter aerilatus TaxID=2932251 RepID=A0A8T9SVZ8_9BACT|nr:protoporphyrinogen oxidase [Hymenobacter aerilatus]UOR06045.1 protoporphyrinogen oxidase [Hymenobacter aerilatus]